MKKLIRFFCILLVLSFLPLYHFAALAQETDGIVRVLLTKLNLTDTVSLSLDGSYTLNGISFQRGSDLTISCKTGTLMVYYEGMALDAGKSLTLQRHAAEDGKENGLRFSGLYELHPGDLVLSIYNGSLRAVLHTPVEEYLLGVVPFEMSDSFPLEALKAQAVTARTYALRKAGSSSDYDLVDNTNDQAYMGLKAENVNAARAVQETKGICGVYQGKLAECFYSASNGGQTELVHHVWKGGDYGYFRMTDDPYDLENPESVVMQASLPKSISGDNQLGSLKTYIYDSIHEPLAAKGFDMEQPFRVTGIEHIEMTTPMFTDSPSKMMTEARFTFQVKGQRFEEAEEELSIFSLTDTSTPAPSADSAVSSVPATASVTISVPAFDVLENALSLSINATDNELISVRETDDGFVFESRRYGHGVGMSQRGAQWMAGQYGKTFRDILSFYYPGMALTTYTYTHTLPDALSTQFLATPGPPATPTPRPTAMALQSTPSPRESVVEVTNIGVNSYLNLRSKNSTTSGVLQQLFYGQKLYVTEDLGDWLKVRLDNVEGYVMKEFVNPVE